MSRYLRALAMVAPDFAMKIARTQIALRGYDAAQVGRRTSSFRRGNGSANAEIGRALPILRERSREFVRNSWIGPRALDVLTSHVIGTDLTVRFDTGSARDDKIAQALWDEWTTHADIQEEGNFLSEVSLAFRATMEGGDSIIRMRALSRSEIGTRRVPLALHVGEGDLIDHERDRLALSNAAARARLGVELGANDRRAGYWLHDMAPGEPGRAIAGGFTSNLVPRAEVVHFYRRIRPGQVRGVPVFAPVLMAARDFADLMDALVVKERMQANIGIFVESTDTAGPFAKEATTGAASGPASGLEEIGLRPGMVLRGKPGEKIQGFAPAGNSSFEPVAIAALQGIAAGVGCTYDQITGDLRRANYSSLRAGKIEFRRLVADLQWNMLEPQVLGRITARWVQMAVLAGVLPRRAHGWRRRYVMPAHEPIDPKKDLEADILAVRAGRMSPQDFIGAWGRDWREVVSEWETFLTEIDAKRLIFDLDPRQRTRTGHAVQEPAAPETFDEDDEDDEEGDSA
jgi:lambda family phage portal protein